MHLETVERVPKKRTPGDPSGPLHHFLGKVHGKGRELINIHLLKDFVKTSVYFGCEKTSTGMLWHASPRRPGRPLENDTIKREWSL
eukprot:8104894-Pyramimonas_sp.AAC.1